MLEVVLVDTNIVSFIFRQDSRAALYEKHLLGKLKVIASQTLAELELMPLLNGWSAKRKQKLDEFLKDYLFVEVDKNTCLQWAKIQAEAKKIGRPISTADAWIAASALVFDVSLVTHNPKDFINVSDLRIITEI
jgi:tRNA(fMet)-specific endonuclease VapC